MAFSDEIKKLQRTLRCYLRFQTGTGSENPGVSGTFTDRRWGKVADNTGTVPVKGTIAKFGTFSRALTNADQGFEAPTISTDILDKDNEWRQMAARPWTLINRYFYYALRVLADDGTYIDSDVAWGQLTLPEFSPVAKAKITVQMTPDYLGKKVPRRKIGLDDWPHADSSALNKVVPIVYGKMDNSVGAITGFTAARIDPSGYTAPTIAAVLTTGGNSTPEVGRTVYYAICALDGSENPASPLSNVVAVTPTVGTDNKVNLTWSGPAPPYWRLFRGNDPSFGQMDTYRDGDWHHMARIDGATLAVSDVWMGVDTREQLDPDPHWDLSYRQQVFYWLSAVVGTVEAPAVGPRYVYLAPMNGGGAVQLNWDAVSNATSLILRRGRQGYSFDPGYDRQWTLAGGATSFKDFLNDTSAVTLPDNFGILRGGALEAIYVDTNPAGQAGQYKYLIAGHGCKEVREVYVHKSSSTPQGNSSGGIDRPSGLTAAVSGTPGTQILRYVVTAKNNNGETTASNEVRVENAPNVLSGANNVGLTWADVTGAISYSVFRATDTSDFNRLAIKSAGGGAFFTDDGSFTETATSHPPENNTTGDNFVSGSTSTPVSPVLQTKNVDYFVETVTINGDVYQILRFNAAQGGNAITCNVWGVETLGTATGNGDGGTLIENIVDQFKHFLYNWVFNSYTHGAWYTDTAFKSGLINDASFAAASAVAATRIVGGYKGAGALLDEIDVRQALQDWLTSADLDWYAWDNQFKVKMFDPTVVDRNTLPQYTPKEAIFRESFTPALDVTRHWNEIPWQAGPQVDGYFISGDEKDTASIENYSRTITAPIRTFFWTRHLETATDIALRALRMSKNPPVYATLMTPLKAQNDEIASLIAITHPDGIEAASTGWTKRVCKILRSDVDFDKLVISLQVLDVDALISFLGYVRYGDRTWASADLHYTTAIASGKTTTYGYLADRATGRFSNGDLAKKYWSR